MVVNVGVAEALIIIDVEVVFSKSAADTAEKIRHHVSSFFDNAMMLKAN